MTDRTHLQAFLTLSVNLTGFDQGTLLATGLAERYYDVVLEELGAAGLDDLLDAAAEEAPSAKLLIRLWYTGLWKETLVGPESYREGLFWRAVGANPPGSRPPGYGTWALEPPLRAALARRLGTLILVLAVLFGGWGGMAQAANSGDLSRLEQTKTCNRCDLTRADLAHIDLYGVAITATDLTGADLSGSLMNDARLVQSILVDADLHGVYLTGADLSGSVFSRADLRQARLTNAILRGSVLRDAQLEGADLNSADLRQAQLMNAHLASAQLAGSRLQNADLTGADLTNADLRHADLRGAQLEGALLCGADLQQALMPDGRRSESAPQSC